MKNNWIEQLFVPPLQYGILMQSYDEDTHEIHEQICKDPEKCGSKILLTRDEGHMYDRLPSPVRDSPEPAYSSLIKDGQWKIGVKSDISQNPEIMNKLDSLNESVDELRKNLNNPTCSCADIDNQTFSPDRCKGANLSDQFKWSDRFTHTNPDSTDTDIRHNIVCDNNYDYKSQVDGENLVYNCSRNRWETIGDSRSDKFQAYTFPQGMIHCSDPPDPSDPSDPVKCMENYDCTPYNTKIRAMCPNGPDSCTEAICCETSIVNPPDPSGPGSEDKKTEGFVTRFHRQRQIKPFHIALILLAIFFLTPTGGFFVYRGSKAASDVVLWTFTAFVSIAIYVIIKFY